MAESIREQVAAYLAKHPDSSNQDLYAHFPDVRPNTLRHYKSKIAGPSSKAAKESSKATSGTEKTEVALQNLEKRITQLEEQVQRLTKGKNTAEVEEKKTIFSNLNFKKNENLERIIKEVEDGVFALIKETKAKIKSSKKPEIHLDELQQKIFSKVGKIWSAIGKNKENDKH